MIRSTLSVLVGILTWFVVATVLNWLLRAALPGYSAVEKAMAFTLTMLLCRLALGLISSFCAGAASAAVSRQGSRAPAATAVCLVLLFLPVHYSLWSKFPVWYHLFFLATLAPAVLLGVAASCRLTADR